MSVKLYSYEEIAKHNTRSDLWMVIDGKVYDITPFTDEHPGGEEVLIDEGAKDASTAFDDVGHSEDARAMLAQYYVGDVDSASKPVKVVRQDEVISEGPKGNPLRIIAPMLLLAAYLYYTYFL
ncbi:cytochrome b5-like heme/steroid binding domain-containing protein [Helicostylum pulchrum]|uniref:Cytochrome b5 heme-binding domain-containing protein n=1 Tax=Helicostylum pulchrum TaxID=562976 RepID=A0ABP9XQI6_9FUNG|nr:cytochrome b5-like heme/steroid binding domain-containing protein [Helicostylum pulchrum]